MTSGKRILEAPTPLMPAATEALTRELLRLAIRGVALLAVTAMALAVFDGPHAAILWIAAALTCWGVVLFQCRRRLHLNRSAARAEAFSTLGHGNRITMLRGLLIAATAGFLLIIHDGISPWLLYVPAVLYTAAALGDLLDGYLARRQQQTTLLGTELDTALDALGLLIAPLLAVIMGKLHVSYLLVSVAYYLFQWGIAWRRRHARPVYPLPPSRLRRPLAGAQMTLVAIALWPPLPGVATSAVGLVLMIPLLLGFCRDWLCVSGRLGAHQEPF